MSDTMTTDCINATYAGEAVGSVQLSQLTVKFDAQGLSPCVV